ncbi:KpsF/GutQ family sugar-phosphate isomerase [Vibrio sp. DW001]|uniref:KpsF/GutQ family sugar-phosphate isomerase n=1 Tax=Vibrio sp. DW001 TaxID=2912315 RepID=UPI0023AF29E2|nr:KpsF/GutQ family sugar-phosphate isomerase [Vibrio sp. DW001]WED25926.1 KpsF/GutQ family sugar-phosphate isomerase [Vibrio sp. DW001]
MNIESEHIKKLGITFLRDELIEANHMLERIDDEFVNACRILSTTKGKVVVMGVGKSGHIGKKIAATFASTGTQAFFIHPTEALHGDMGMIGKADSTLLISYSGEANEFRILLPLLAAQGNKVISITGNKNSTLSISSDAALNVAINQEACPLGLAPTSSALCTLMMGDALALTVMSQIGFSQNDFARSHPAGSLGAKLLTTVIDVLDNQIEGTHCFTYSSLLDAVDCLCLSGKGLIAIIDDNQVVGVFSDGDFRRAIANKADLNGNVDQYMSKNFHYIGAKAMCTHALASMNTNHITALPVLHPNHHLIGIVSVAQIHAAGIR